jgi:hypothetical protein
MTLPNWMRRALFATSVMNALGAVAFAPPAGALRALVGMPETGHPLYLAMVSMFVLLFGVGYLWAAVSGHVDRLFITIATVGKLSFFTLLLWFWITDALPALAVLTGTGDLAFGIMFLVWLVNT